MRQWFPLLALALAWLPPVQARPQAFVPVASDARDQLIDTWSVERFKQVLEPERAAFSGVQVPFAVPRYAAKLYRVVHDTTVPEQDKRPTQISGLVAVPEGVATTMPQTTSPFWKLVEQSEAYRWRSRVPLHLYYGEQDEVTPVPIALLPQAYQSLIGGAPTESFSAGAKVDHRATFTDSVSHQKAWFDSFVVNSR